MAIFADFLVAIHVAYVAFVVLAVPLILVGWACGWQWIHNAKFRILHLVMIGVVVGESLLSIECPLTTWEQNLRVAAGQTGPTGSFIGHWLHELLFVDLPPETLTIIYTAFGALVVALLFLAPIRFKRGSPAPAESAG